MNKKGKDGKHGSNNNRNRETVHHGGGVLLAFAIRKDVVPFLQSKMTADQLKAAQEMASMFVYMAQQVFSDKSGKERKEIVRKALQNALFEAGIDLSDQFVDDMIEAAVKGMKIAESGNQKESN